MQNRPARRPIDEAARKLAPKRCYTLAAAWLKLVRSVKRLKVGQPVAGLLSRLAGTVAKWHLRRRSIRKDAIWTAIFSRYTTAYRQVLAAAGCARERVGPELTICVLRLHDAVNADPKNRCLPEMMWQACARARILPPEARSGLQARFHLRALLDELPSSDERAAVHYFVFPTQEEREKRKLTGVDIRATYGPDRRRDVELGIDLFAEYLHKKRSKVELLTAGAIPATKLATHDDAWSFLVESIG